MVSPGRMIRRNQFHFGGKAMSLHRVILACVGMSLIGGCAGEKKLPAPPKLYVAKGKVLLNSQPVPVGTVVFTPEKAGHGVRAEGLLKQDGTFAVAAYGGYEGTTPGAYI